MSFASYPHCLYGAMSGKNENLEQYEKGWCPASATNMKALEKETSNTLRRDGPWEEMLHASLPHAAQ